MDTHGRDGLSELIYGVGPRILDESPRFWPEDIFGIGPGGQVDRALVAQGRGWRVLEVVCADSRDGEAS